MATRISTGTTRPTATITSITATTTGDIITVTTRNAGTTATDMAIRAATTDTSAIVIMMIMATAIIGVTGIMANTSVSAGVTMQINTIAGAGTGAMVASAAIRRPGFGILERHDAEPRTSAWQALLRQASPHAIMNGGSDSLTVAVSDIRHTNTENGLAVQDNDQINQALEAFFASHEENAFYVAYAALWHRETAMDVVQESMTRLIQYYRDKPATDWPALFRTILNSRINDVRRKRLIEQGKHKLISLTGLFHKDQDERHALDEYDVPSEQRHDGITAPEVEVVRSELRQQVEQALKALSERQRQVFILREWRGMTIRETSQTLGCSENSVKQHHFRALRELRRQLAEVWEHA